MLLVESPSRASFQAPVTDFLLLSISEILGQVTAKHRHRQLEQAQVLAWSQQIEILQQSLSEAPHGYIFLEFEIPRVGRRADVILLLGELLVILEFKVGAKQYDAAAIDQPLDYALDLKNFHHASHDARIIPVLVATEAPSSTPGEPVLHNGVSNTLCTNREGLADLLNKLNRIDLKGIPQRDALAWATSPYTPTPTIVEAARALYRGHRVQDLSRADAGATNLTRTCSRIGSIIDEAKQADHKAICFVTGAPGSGKTLAGLNIATERMRSRAEEHAVFLSGNGPLVAVLQEALTRDELVRQKDGIRIKKTEAERRAKAFVQNIHRFRDDSLLSTKPPVERVAVFDEAQRAWDLMQTSKFMKSKRGQAEFSMSEPAFLLSVMNRHPGWCVVVCLVGEGQEINTGEAGIREWFDALESRFPHWRIHRSSRLAKPGALLGSGSLPMDDDLHLSVSLRSFRAESLANFVTAVLENRAEEARELLKQMPSYPICLTRNVVSARRWLRHHARGTERTGLVASSNGLRLKPHGVHVKCSIQPELWFLNGKADIRSSFQLEDVATEFDIQGLELDWVGVCWDANLRRVADDWKEFKFKGTVWQNVNNTEDQRYTRNAYRVLLTRARQGFVIFIPPGDDSDPTCPKHWYDSICSFLMTCGIPSIDHV